MSNIHTDREYYVPVMSGERQFYLSSDNYDQAINSAVKHEETDWEELQRQGWTIESFWGSEYE